MDFLSGDPCKEEGKETIVDVVKRRLTTLGWWNGVHREGERELEREERIVRSVVQEKKENDFASSLYMCMCSRNCLDGRLTSGSFELNFLRVRSQGPTGGCLVCTNTSHMM